MSPPHEVVRSKILKTTTSSSTPKSVLLGVFFCSMKKGGNTVKHSKVLSGLFVAVLFVVAAQTAMAQSTIFNIPSTDTVSKGKGYFEFDFLPQAPGPDSGSSIGIYNPRGLVGLPHNTEIGVNIPIYHVPSSVPSAPS